MNIPPAARTQLREALSSLESVVENIESFKAQNFQGQDPDGYVSVSISAGKSIDSIDISRQAVRELDNHTLGDTVVAAINAAESAVQEASDAMVAGVTIGGVSVSEFINDPNGTVDRALRREAPGS